MSNEESMIFFGWHWANPIHRNEVTFRSIPLEDPHEINRTSRNFIDLNLRAKIELLITYSYTNWRRLYIMRRVFLRYTLCTRRRISSKLVLSARESAMDICGVTILGECDRRKFLSSREHRSDSSIHSKGLLTHDRLVEPTTICSDWSETTLPENMDNIFVRRIKFSLLSFSRPLNSIYI